MLRLERAFLLDILAVLVFLKRHPKYSKLSNSGTLVSPTEASWRYQRTLSAILWRQMIRSGWLDYVKVVVKCQTGKNFCCIEVLLCISMEL